MATATEKKFLTIKQLMERWMISRTTIYSEITRGRLRKTLIAGSVRFSIAEVERYERVSS